MTDNNRIKTFPMAAAAIMLVVSLASGCGPSKSVSPTASASSDASSSTASNTTAASVIVPEDSLPPLPGVMTSVSPDPAAASKTSLGSS